MGAHFFDNYSIMKYMQGFLNCGVYIWRNKAKPWKVYVGSAVNFTNRKERHLDMLNSGTHNPKFQNAWNKYGEEGFEFEPTIFCPEEDLLFHEQLAINAFDAVNSGYNVCPVAGSRLGTKQSEETRRKISESLRGNQHLKGHFPSEATRLLISKKGLGNKRALGSPGRRGQTNSPEHRRKTSEGLTGKKRSPESVEKGASKLRGRKGHPQSEETKAIVSKTHKGRKQTPEHVQKRADAIKSRKR